MYIHLETSAGIWRHQEASALIWKHPPDTQEASREHPGGTQEAPRRHPGGTQEAPRRHPGGTQESPRGTKDSREGFDTKCAKTIKFYCQKWRERPFRVDGSDVTLTVPAAWAQKLIGEEPVQRPPTLHPPSNTSRQNPSV